MILEIIRGVLCTLFLHFLPLRTMSTSTLGGVGDWFGVLCAYNVCLFGFVDGLFG